jgi:predicted secreted protein
MKLTPFERAFKIDIVGVLKSLLELCGLHMNRSKNLTMLLEDFHQSFEGIAKEKEALADAAVVMSE